MLVRADPSVRVIAYDHRGHGNSPSVSTAAIEQLADDLAAIVNTAVPTGSIVFGGHSVGGMTLMALAQRHPRIVAERVRGVAFVATSAGDLLGAIRRIPGAERVLKALLLLTARFKTPSKPLVLLRYGARGAFGKHPRRRDLNRAVLQTSQSDPRAVAALGRSLLEHNRYDALVAFRDVAVVVIAGTRDWLTSPVHARRIADHLPDSSMVVLRDAGHFLPYERREAITAHLLNLVSKARDSATSCAGVAG
jgi:pimeloyl-ACP methyl ester carboxylesterase